MEGITIKIEQGEKVVEFDLDSVFAGLSDEELLKILSDYADSSDVCNPCVIAKKIYEAGILLKVMATNDGFLYFSRELDSIIEKNKTEKPSEEEALKTKIKNLEMENDTLRRSLRDQSKAREIQKLRDANDALLKTLAYISIAKENRDVSLGKHNFNNPYNPSAMANSNVKRADKENTNWRCPYDYLG